MRRPVAALAAVPVLAVGMACSPVDAVKPYRELAAELAPEANRTWPLLPAEPDDLFRVLAEGEGTRVELLRSEAGIWSSGEGAGPAAASLMQDAEDHLIPMPAYRRLEVDAADPDFGFGDHTLTFVGETRTAQRWTVRIGGPNPTGGGYYARRDGDPFVYVVVRQVADDIRSLVLGAQVVRPPDPIVEQILTEDARTEDPEEVTNPWLAQVLETNGESTVPSP